MLILATLVAWSALTIQAQQAPQVRVQLPDEKSPVLLVLGDSLSAGYGISLAQGWVTLLQTRIEAFDLPHRVINASISGDTAAGGLSRLPRLLREHRPAVLVIELGANDGLRGFSPKRIESTLGAMVGLAQEANCRVLIVGVRLPPNYGAAYSERFQRIFVNVANKFETALSARLLDGVAERPELMQADGLHPLASAQPKLLDNVWTDLLPLLQATAPAVVQPTQR
ncbi:MAG TPA: arylesterase [Chromatiaceae bacterium]|jgi:acyl-CoA thioesterase-1|nr:MAG: hypothetical protein N838_16665 [Thiohalocapsa sp. PB-PSB1]QQO56368.1 MAG: arylesterase [Thiohalocapsa sp. PB-PSB1]HBG97161.1 arylesterase [Chromatiaceae bacterium]HCS88609.1 arylesterase [Chromatiaceae bacterium]